MQINEKKEQLQNLIKRKITNSELASILNLGSGQAVLNRINRGTELKDFEILKLDEAFKDEINKTNHNQTNNVHKDNSEDFAKITLDYYPDIDFSCGNGLIPFGETKEQITIPVSLIRDYRKERKYIIVNAKSDSMVPEIKPNDLLIIRVIDTEPIIDNHIYIFCYDERLYCKYLSWNIHQIIVRSANPDYATQLIEKENINLFQLYGEVVGHFRSYEG